jgi:hypothetical protein
LSEAEPIIEVDFEKLTADTLEVRRRFDATRSGVINAFGVYFDLEVTEGHVISTRPSVASAASSWQVTIWLVDKPFPVSAETSLELVYRHTPTATTLECVTA